MEKALVPYCCSIPIYPCPNLDITHIKISRSPNGWGTIRTCVNVFVFLEQLEVVESLSAGLAVKLEVSGVLAIVVGQRLHTQ